MITKQTHEDNPQLKNSNYQLSLHDSVIDRARDDGKEYDAQCIYIPIPPSLISLCIRNIYILYSFWCLMQQYEFSRINNLMFTYPTLSNPSTICTKTSPWRHGQYHHGQSWVEKLPSPKNTLQQKRSRTYGDNDLSKCISDVWMLTEPSTFVWIYLNGLVKPTLVFNT